MSANRFYLENLLGNFTTCSECNVGIPSICGHRPKTSMLYIFILAWAFDPLFFYMRGIPAEWERCRLYSSEGHSSWLLQY